MISLMYNNLTISASLIQQKSFIGQIKLNIYGKI